MKVIMTGGGTGGHIYPAVAIADEIKKRHPDADILFVGTEKGMEKNIVPKAGYPVEFITVSGINRRQIWKNIKTLRDFNKGMAQAKKIIKDFGPDVVIGTGGYVCGPVVSMASRLGVRCFIHEQNAFPGIANKFLSSSTERVFVAFEEAIPYFKKCRKTPLTVGNPVREAFSDTDRDEARKELGIGPDDFVILSFGGSLGAQRINDEMKIAADRFKAREGVRIFFVTGRRYYESITSEADTSNARVTYLEYLDDMPVYLAACDLAVTRSGALTVSEITACGRAAIMVPSPYVTANHQYFNAKTVADRGGAVLIEEKDLSEGGIADAIEALLSDRDRIKKMEQASAACGKLDAAGVICDTIGI